MRTHFSALSLAALACIAACVAPGQENVFESADAGGAALGESHADTLVGSSALEEFLSSLDDVRWERMATDVAGYQSYVLYFEQPVDHQETGGRSFQQRIVLHHRDENAPMVLYTSGYSLFRPEYLAELTVGMGANQINVEQRFFSKSIPRDIEPEDWRQVTIEQAATDHHRIIEALSAFYAESWISTGHSKGGMASIFHRRFFPGDVDATVAYVAPLSFGVEDERYSEFLQNLGSMECRKALRDTQRRALEHFAELLPMAEAIAARDDLRFSRSGGHAAAFQRAIATLEWSFWQYRGESACDTMPSAEATDSELFDFVRASSGIGAHDALVATIDTYYAQARYQLGLPRIATDHLSDLLSGPVPSLLPVGAPEPNFDASAMLDIQDWLSSQESARILFVYGALDPWSAGQFDTSDCRDCPTFTVERRSHDALLHDLGSAEQRGALDAIEAWTGIRPTIAEASVRRAPMLRISPPVVGISR